jgi:hypothetical protein
MEQSPLYVSWTIRSSRGRHVTYLLELIELPRGGRTSWDVEREVVLHPDGRIRSKSPTPSNPDPSADMHPDPREAIATGEMTEILPAEFESCWQMPVNHGPGPLRRLLDRARR